MRQRMHELVIGARALPRRACHGRRRELLRRGRHPGDVSVRLGILPHLLGEPWSSKTFSVFFSSTFRAKATSSRPRKSPRNFSVGKSRKSKNIGLTSCICSTRVFYSGLRDQILILMGRRPRGPKACQSSRRPGRPRSIATRAQRERRASKLYRSAASEAGIRGRGRDPKQSKQPQQESRAT